MGKTHSFPTELIERKSPRAHHILGPLIKQCNTHCCLTLALNNLRKIVQRLAPFSRRRNRGSEITCALKV